MHNSTDGLARLQNQSRISATIWRRWCTLLKLDPGEAIRVWEEIGYPVMVATRKVPDMSYILQMRVARSKLDIFDFKEEVPKVLHTLAFLDSLKDEELTKRQTKSVLLKFYRKIALRPLADQSPDSFLHRYLIDLCAAIVVAKILPVANIALSGVMKPVLTGHVNIDAIVGLGLKTLGEKSYASKVRECLASWERTSTRLSLVADNKVISGDDGGDEKVGGDGEEDYAEGDCGDGEVAGGSAEIDSVEVYLTQFKCAIQALYESEAQVEAEQKTEDEADVEKIKALLGVRIKAIDRFKPLQEAIPSIEEAQLRAKVKESRQSPVRKRESTVGIKSGNSGSGRARGAMPGASIIKNVIARRQYSGGEVDTAGESVQSTIAGGADTGEIDLVEFADLSLAELTDRVRDIGKLLAAVETDESQCWELLTDPTFPIVDLNELARRINTVGTGADRASRSIRRIFCHLKLKDFLQVAEDVTNEDRLFQIEVRIFINAVNTDRALKLSSRLLASLGRIIDHAGAALARLEMLKINHIFALNNPQDYDREAVALRFEELWGAFIDRVDPKIGGPARRVADADTAALLALFCGERFVENLLETVRHYMAALCAGGWGKEIADLKARFAEQPIQFEKAVEDESQSDPIPDELLVASEMGEIFDEAYCYVITAAWSVLSPEHQREVVAQQIKQILREVLVGSIVFTPEMRHHQDNPSEALPVVSLDKVTGNGNLRDYYLQVRSSGEIAYIEDFADGQYIDIFEIRELEIRRMHAATQQEKEAQGADPAQAGRKYLFTIGRTKHIFGDTPNELIDGCIRAESGGPKIFNDF